jgi:hypothetical protein
VAERDSPPASSADFRAATVRLLLLDPHDATQTDVWSIEAKIVELCDGIETDAETREKLDVQRDRVRACVARWI